MLRFPARGLLTAAFAAALLAGCGDSGGSTPAAERTPSPTERSSSSSPSSGASPSRDPLADQVESLATKTPKGNGIRLTDPTHGSDMSWPQCEKGVGPIPERVGLGMPMPDPAWRFTVVGLTNGPAMTRNPCLSDQLAWARQHDVLVSAYAVATYPSENQLDDHGDDGPYDAGTERGRLANWGYAQAEFNLETLREAGLELPGLWIDVEPVPSPPLVAWSDDRDANAAVVKGIARSYRDSGMDIGVYSTPSLWDTVVGDLSFDVPEWRAAGQTSQAEAVRRCGEESIQGGDALVGQWVEDRRDRNVTCPGQAQAFSDWLRRP